jgi:hypothetical protein
MLCKGAKEKNWKPALKGADRLLAVYDYTTFGIASDKTTSLDGFSLHSEFHAT